MTTEQIKEQLCYADERNPYNLITDYSITNSTCYCVNCESGRSELANELLREKEINKEMLTAIENTRKWYIKEGFNALKPDTPLVFNSLLSICFKYSEDRDRFI